MKPIAEALEEVEDLYHNYITDDMSWSTSKAVKKESRKEHADAKASLITRMEGYKLKADLYDEAIKGKYIGFKHINPTNWTKEKPSDFNWYWYRESEGEYEQIVHLFSHEMPSGKIMVNTEYKQENIIDMNGEWAGPIQEPTDKGETNDNS